MTRRVAVTDLVDRAIYRDLAARRDGPALVFVAGHLAVLAGTGWLVHASLATWWLPLAWFAHGVVLVHLFAPLHECTHYTAFRSCRLNDAVAWFCGLGIVLSPTFFPYEHRAHHANTNHEDDDPELIALPSSVAGYLWYLSTIPYWAGWSTTWSTTPSATSTRRNASF